jgi:hypothetical protein
MLFIGGAASPAFMPPSPFVVLRTDGSIINSDQVLRVTDMAILLENPSFRASGRSNFVSRPAETENEPALRARRRSDEGGQQREPVRATARADA